MTNLEIIENNKLIAEFMGAIHCNDAPEDYPDGYYLTTTEEESDLPLLPEEWEFHSSWDWLMPVVEKIESLPLIEDKGICVMIEGEYCRIYTDDWGKYETISESITKRDKLMSTYKAVVKFIKWYNQQNPKP